MRLSAKTLEQKKRRQVSRLPRDAGERGELTPSRPLSPSKYQEFLEPWIRIANLASPDSDTKEAEKPGFIDYLMDKAGPARPHALLRSEMEDRFNNLIAEVFSILYRLAQQRKGWRGRLPGGSIAVVGIRSDGLIDTGFFNPLELFLSVLQDVPAERIRICLVCERIFFALRRDRTCCSKECNHVRHVHKSAGNWDEYRQNRKFRSRTKLPAVKGKERRVVTALHQAIMQGGSET